MYRNLAIKAAWLTAAGITLPGCGALHSMGIGRSAAEGADLVCEVDKVGGSLHIIDRKTGEAHATLDQISPVKNGVMSGPGAVVDFERGEESGIDRFTADFNQGRCYAGIKYWLIDVTAPMSPELLRSRFAPTP